MSEPSYDGIHTRGPLARQHYTNSVLRIFKEIIPALQNKHFPKVTKGQAQPLKNDARHRPPPHQPKNQSLSQGQRKQVHYNRRHFDDRQRNRRYPAQGDGHWDCPQAKYQAANKPTNRRSDRSGHSQSQGVNYGHQSANGARGDRYSDVVSGNNKYTIPVGNRFDVLGN